MKLVTRILVSLALAAAAVVVTAAPTAGDNPVIVPILPSDVTVELVPWVQIPDSAIGRPRLNAMATTGNRLFVVEEYDGRIYEIVTVRGLPQARLFFDVKAAIAASTDRELDNESLFQGGLRGLAFHPEFAANGLFYTTVLESRPATPDPADYLSDPASPVSVDSVLIEWSVDPASGLADPGSYRQVFRIGMPVYDHPIKQIAFNPFAPPDGFDYGMLYIAHGDASDHAATAGGGLNNDALGKILRIDPVAQDGAPYRVPDDNPFFGDPIMLDEVYSLGHRNPHHLAFAREDTGQVHLVSAETGHDNVDEVNLIVGGGNYGWSDREGTFVHLPSGGLIFGIAPLPEDDVENGYSYPAAQMGHDGEPGPGPNIAQALAGGFVVDNGSELDGQYFYGDFPRTGRLFHSELSEMASAVTRLEPDDPSRDHPDELTQARTWLASVTFDHDRNPTTPALRRTDLTDVFNDAADYDGSGRADIRFGQGPHGELYVMSKRNGWVYLVANSLPPELATCEGRPRTQWGTIGTAGDDVLVGTYGRDVMKGFEGDDVMCGLAGRDRLRGGPGNDVILGGTGRDVIAGEIGRDTLRGGNGGDRVNGNAGADIVFGGGGNDRLFGGRGADTANGGIGTDLCEGFTVRTKCEAG